VVSECSSSATPISFGLVAQGASTVSKTETISNTGGLSIHIDSIRLVQISTTARFSLDTSATSHDIPAGGSTTVTVRMTTQHGDTSASAMIRVYTSCSSTPILAPVTGQIENPICDIPTTLYDFRATYVGMKTVDTLHIRNLSTLAALRVDSISGLTAPFALESPVPAFPVTVYPGQTLSVLFSYTAPDTLQHSTVVHVYSNSERDCATVSLVAHSLEPPSNRTGGLGKWSPISTPVFVLKGWRFDQAGVIDDSVNVCSQTHGSNAGDPAIPSFRTGATALADFRFDGYRAGGTDSIIIQTTQGMLYLGNEGTLTPFFYTNYSFRASLVTGNGCGSTFQLGDVIAIRAHTGYYALIKLVAVTGAGPTEELHFDYYYPVMAPLPRVVHH